MKKRALAAMLLLTLLLGGCAGGAKNADYKQAVRDTLARSYTFTADIAYGEETASAVIQKTGKTDLSISFTAPEILSGLTVVTAGETLTASYRGVELDLSAYNIPSQSVISVLETVLAAEPSDNLEVTEQNGVLTARGTLVIASYEIDFDQETMAIKAVRVPSIDGTLTVSEFTFDD